MTASVAQKVAAMLPLTLVKISVSEIRPVEKVLIVWEKNAWNVTQTHSVVVAFVM